MPEISRFFGICIAMRFREHPPPHFHAEYSGQRASFRIDNLEILEGEVPLRVRRLVEEWATRRRSELMENWHRTQEGKPPKKIEPLE